MMIHKSIQITNLELSFPHKTCFQDFNIQINSGNRIAIIGRNGSGKSTLLKILLGTFKATSGYINLPKDVVFGYVPQIIDEFCNLSGGQRLNQAMTHALSLDPNVLLLDEPTNHLDSRNRKSLMRMLSNYLGTLIIVSHDTELLRNCVDTLWHIDNGKIHIFSGNYDDYMREISKARSSTEHELALLERRKKDTHQELMKEQNRAAKSKVKGEKSIHQRKWPTVVSKAKALRAEATSGNKKSAIDHKKQKLTEHLSNLVLPEIILPKFSLNSSDIGDYTIVSISDASVGYTVDNPLLCGVNLSLNSKKRIAILGENGSGKSTIVKAILGDNNIVKTGDWHAPKRTDIGYLDQHYSTLDTDKTVLESISSLVPSWSHSEVRRHLNRPPAKR